MLAEAPRERYVFNLGHGVPPEADPGLITHLAEVVRAFRYETVGVAGVSTAAVLVMAYGTPAGPDDLEAYYTHIRRGHAPTPELLAELRGRYEAIGGLSPLLAITRAQMDAIGAALEARGHRDVAVELGMKHAPAVHRGRRRRTHRRWREPDRRRCPRAPLLGVQCRRVRRPGRGGSGARRRPAAGGDRALVAP